MPHIQHHRIFVYLVLEDVYWQQGTVQLQLLHHYQLHHYQNVAIVVLWIRQVAIMIHNVNGLVVPVPYYQIITKIVHRYSIANVNKPIMIYNYVNFFLMVHINVQHLIWLMEHYAHKMFITVNSTRHRLIFVLIIGDNAYWSKTIVHQ